MATITVLIQHSRKLSEENCYVEYNIDGIVLKEYASYYDLFDLISVQLNIDLTKKCMKIKYIVEDRVLSECCATSGLIGGIVALKLRNHERKYTSNYIMDDVRLDLDIDINYMYMLAWRAKEKALETILGQPVASYEKLSGYLHTLDKTYPGSHIRMKKALANEFLYLLKRGIAIKMAEEEKDELSSNSQANTTRAPYRAVHDIDKTCAS
ncbi:hypothetical protein RDI58_010864 [Solanum bulbocastanum]|uniref:Uncharacterized protein n=1 Tax=Solanum bulbocastanum TaxID=147425 RepID=A0AAN8TVV6_SOLBU